MFSLEYQQEEMYLIPMHVFGLSQKLSIASVYALKEFFYANYKDQLQISAATGILSLRKKVAELVTREEMVTHLLDLLLCVDPHGLL